MSLRSFVVSYASCNTGGGSGWDPGGWDEDGTGGVAAVVEDPWEP